LKITIGRIPLTFDASSELSLQIRSPAKVRNVAFVMSERLISRSGRPEFDEQLVIFVETSTDGPLLNRKFAIAPTGQTMQVKEGIHVSYLGTAIGPATMTEAHLFEVLES
jgi:hypothetical protein